MHSDAFRIDVFSDEKKTVPADMHNKHLVCHGFTPTTTIHDFPIRGKAVYLHIRRRKWIDTIDNTIHTRRCNGQKVGCLFSGI